MLKYVIQNESRIRKNQRGRKKRKKMLLKKICYCYGSRSRRPAMVLPENPIFPFFPPNEC